MGLFLSTTINKVDSKGRVSVPANFRAALKQEEFQGVILFPGNTDQHEFLEGCGMEFLERLSAGLETLPTFSEEQETINHFVFAAAAQLAYDQTGRIMLPREMMDATGITTQATFVGLGKTFQVWEPEAYKQHVAQLRQRSPGRRPSAPALADVPRPSPRGSS
jgi:MraZ protein